MYRKLTRAALLLALMIVLHSLRLLIPVPPFISMFVIGSAINGCLLLAAETAGGKAAFLIACLSPVISYIQQALPLPIFILPVAVTNVVYVLVYRISLSHNRWYAIVLAALCRMLALFFASAWVFELANLPEQQAAVLKGVMSWPQLITGIAGGVFSGLILKRLPVPVRYAS